MPVTVTTSSKVIVIAIDSLRLYDPSTVGDVTAVTAGTLPSTTMSLSTPSEPVVPGNGNDKIASFPLGSLMVPPFKNNASVRV